MSIPGWHWRPGARTSSSRAALVLFFRGARGRFLQSHADGILAFTDTARRHANGRSQTRQAWSLYEDLRRDWRVDFAGEPMGLETRWIALMNGSSGANTWTDAYLAAFAMGHNYTLVSFDRGFGHWKALAFHLLV